ncbi:membrane protein insertase YidC [Komagataeibacter oboediens]|uniref:membrane protein insertase YidC n=1 Tax=Komagataeibacter oboediens TaxID=65958 RepID=UPI001C2DD3E3|nr:membrane protein insertase YidC [Komagataeibacter oboediens]MBV1823638.1 membrane protein insertase YidC [Komagataeibacter oboediens]
MDIKRFMVATALSAVVLVGFEYFLPQQNHKTVEQQAPTPAPAPASAAGNGTAAAAPVDTGQPDPRVTIDADRVHGSLDLRGARLDDLVLKNYHETVKDGSPLVRVLEPRGQAEPNLVEVGWTNVSGGHVSVPDANTVWTADHDTLTRTQPVTLSWDNGQGQVFQISIAIDQNYMFSVTQKVINHGGEAVSLYPFSRVERAYTPVETGGYLVHEGPISVIDHKLDESSYKSLRKGAVPPGNIAWTKAGQGGWAGITDKYWLSAVIPQQDSDVAGTYAYQPTGGDRGIYDVGFTARAPLVVAAGGDATTASHVFAGAKEVPLLEKYESSLHIPDFWKAVDFGWFAFLTRPIFTVLDWLNTMLGNFGLALMAFTLLVKALFFPLATKQFHSMGKMRQLQPKIKALRERYKDDQMALNQQMIALYKQEGVNPASGCLPMLLQIPVFWCLYKDLYVTIEMRHAPFFGWIHDLSSFDPTNLFTLFGLIPWNPSVISPMLQLGLWPIAFGLTMFAQMRLNPAPAADPAQQKMFQFMPIIFTFFMARQPSGLVIYYCWNNLLTMAQQTLIQRRMNRGTPAAKAPAKPKLPAGKK